MRFLIVLAGAATASALAAPAARQRVTEGELKLVFDTPPGVAREGPSWDPAGYLYFVGNNKVSRMNSEGKVEAFKDPSPGANGTLLDPQKRLVVCESQSRRVIRIERNGSVTVLADSYEGKKFNSPNDASIDSKGRIYFSDPRYGRRDTMEILDAGGKQVEGVYRVDAPGKVARVTTHEVDRPNGLLVSPGDRYLYVADNNNNTQGGARKIWRFDLKKAGTIDPASRKLIFDWHTARGPDGFKMDRQGRLFVAAGLNRASRFETIDEYKGGVFIISPEGKLIEFVPLPKDETTNLAFGGPDLKTLYITCGGSLYSIRVKTAGLITAR
ncbi:MAG TPA: SMP-30/gluconolactonase/LRE family protein [Bryobacteraceae bacterium]|nr:SMP-30/gluconolactonase/LRE family protein [Bryobacteraceae bacterium]